MWLKIEFNSVVLVLILVVVVYTLLLVIPSAKILADLADAMRADAEEQPSPEEPVVQGRRQTPDRNLDDRSLVDFQEPGTRDIVPVADVRKVGPQFDGLPIRLDELP